MRQLFHRTIYRLRCTSRRVAIGWRFAIGRSRADDGYNLLHAGEELTGAYSLESLYVCSLTDSLVDRYGEEHRAVLEELAERACSRVASKWDSTDDIQGWAEEWAGDLVAEYAAEAGLELTDSWDVAAARSAALDIYCIEPAGRV